jgi:hypothetical protein
VIWWLLRSALLSRVLRFAALMLMGLALAMSGCVALTTQTLQFAAYRTPGGGGGGAASGPFVPDVPPIPLDGAAGSSPPAASAPLPASDVPAPATSGNLSAVQRYQLALSVGFSPAEAVVALAVALAENGPGNPNAVNANRNKAGVITSYDLGIWQINDSHAAMAGGRANLFDPVINARVALALYRSGGWTQWCTFPGGCGGLPGVANFASLLAQAQAVAASFATGG